MTKTIIVRKDFKCKHPPKSERIKVNIKKPKKKKIQKGRPRKASVKTDFYSSDEWRSLRYRVLRKYSGECMCCGRSKKKHNVIIHVDHIKPRSRFPHLELSFENLQILCEDCNLGKSNTDCVDWRPDDI